MDKNKSLNKFKPEFSREIEIDSSILDKKHQVSASKHELENLSLRFSIEKILNLDIDYMITKRDDLENCYTLICSLKSKVVKFFIKDNEEIADINEKFDIVLLDKSYETKSLDFLAEEDIEFISENNTIDVGEICAQYLSLFVFM